jgi:hypothetical protein
MKPLCPISVIPFAPVIQSVVAQPQPFTYFPLAHPEFTKSMADLRIPRISCSPSLRKSIFSMHKDSKYIGIMQAG